MVEGERQRRGGEIAETGVMFGGGRRRLATRGEGSGGGDGGVALGLSPFFYQLTISSPDLLDTHSNSTVRKMLQLLQPNCNTRRALLI